MLMRKQIQFILKILIVLSTLLILVSCSKGDFYLMGKSKLTLEVHTPYVDPGYYIKDNQTVIIDGVVDEDTLGTYTLFYTTTIKEKSVTLKRIVNVVDTTAPVLTLNGSTENLICFDKTYIEEGFSALDNYDGDLSSSVIIKKIKDGFSYRISDLSGNKTELTRRFILEDKQAPTLELSGSPLIKIQKDSHYIEYGAKATDNCGDISSKITISDNIQNSVLGTYTVTYSVTDENENTTTINREVIVTDEAQAIVYLTFDDGPSSITLDVLDLLETYKVKATFFVWTKKTEFEPIMMKAFQQGHTIALHTASHNYNVIYASTTNYFNDLYSVQSWVKSVTGSTSMILRFPGGSSNKSSDYNPGIMTKVTTQVLQKGFHYFDWNVSSGDGSNETTTPEIVNNVTRNIKSSRINVVLMHDSKNHQATLDALPEILNYLQSIGAKVLPITMDTPQIHHTVNN